MVELWFGIVSVMLTMYVVMDGFDLGAGVLHLLVARSNEERRQVLAAIGPYWDANEVWLLATGGALFVAFPRVLASGLSGFYFAIFLVLWCLILRGVSIEFRGHVDSTLWRAFWDSVFALGSTLLCVFFGCALGNLLRGLPLNAEGWFSLPLFTDFSTRSPVGILDWFTVLVGVFALIALVMQGGTYLAWKTDGPVMQRSGRLAAGAAGVLCGLWPVMTILTLRTSPQMFAQFATRPLAWVCALLAAVGLVAVLAAVRRRSYRGAFLGSSAFLVGLMAATATAVFPVMLRSVGGQGDSLTAFNAGNDPSGLRTALGWWTIGIPLVVAYFVVQFRVHAGKVTVPREGEGY
ncbi:MAG TPA: cytochrome d ubiquinol oxidase subunit II [Candidatus Krumholzibacteria bacterium]|nr:cytochrome d ubiquinol oxidase subunit II [Candidatus Krumholzibacteria bacterium]